MIVSIFMLLQCIFLLPHATITLIIDLYHSIKDKWYLIFEGWGLHVYVGRFGHGKTISMVRDAYLLAKRYPQLSIVTNIQLQGFPVHTNILPLKTPQDILNAPKNTLVLIDEIGTIFNSRDFASSKESIPKILFQHLCQCRKRRLMIYATSQRWNFVDKQLRDIVATVRVCRLYLKHPYSRLNTIHIYDSVEYDRAFTNPLAPLKCIQSYVFIQTDQIRNLYDTSELVQNMLKDDYISDSEILANRGENVSNISELSKTAKRTVKKSVSRI